MQERALARTACANDRDEFSVLDLDIDIAEHGNVVLALADTPLTSRLTDRWVFMAPSLDRE